MRRQIIAFTGISGLGKSTLIKRLAKSISLEHLQASALIREGRQSSGDTALMHDQLRLLDIDENQRFLVQGFRLKAHASVNLILLDCHTIIEINDGITRINWRVFDEIGIDCMIFIADDPEAIAERRRNDTSRSRPERSIADLALIQHQAEEHSAAICRALNISQHVFAAGQFELIINVLRQHCS